MTLKDFTENQETSHDRDVLDMAFSPLERALCKSLTRIEISGKRNRTVPVLLTSAMSQSLHILTSTRERVGINPGNPYLFPRMNYGSLGHIRGYDCVKKAAEDRNSKVKNPELMKSTKLRKQIATIAQVVNLKDNELDILADFLGHDIRIHREYYRLPQHTYQAAKISKLLFALEKGTVTSFAGQSLDKISITADDGK